MKKMFSALFAALALAVVMLAPGCMTTAGTTPVTASTSASQFNLAAASVIQSVTFARVSATQLLLAKKITVAQDKVLQAQLDLVITSVKLAQSMRDKDPLNAAVQLTSATAQLEALKKQQADAAPIPPT